MLDLNVIRDEIDKIDSSIVDLFEKRMNLCKEVAEFKIQSKKNVLDREREKQKIEALKSLTTSEFNSDGIESLFKQVMTISRKLQYKTMSEYGIKLDIGFEMVQKIDYKNAKVVYQGVEGAYSYAAMLRFFGDDVDNFNVATFEEAMKAVSEGRADFAILPIANSSAGMVGDVYDLLALYDNVIVDETYLKVEHALLGTIDGTINDIKTVYSHPQGFMQCGHYLNEHKDWQRISLANTAVAAKKIKADNNRTQAAIASEAAAKMHGLRVLEKSINDNKNNTTRFVIISKNKIYKSNGKKISIYFEAAHESGSLYNLLSNFIYNDINMTKIESRPIPQKTWEYSFFVDFEGNLGDIAVQNALRGIISEANSFKILGNF